MAYAAVVAKDENLNIRMDPAELAALKRAAEADDRPYSGLARRILLVWLRENGWIKDGEK